jgi:predicted ABC-type ATPase
MCAQLAVDTYTWNIHQSAMINVNTQLSSQTYIKQIWRISVLQ